MFLVILAVSSPAQVYVRRVVEKAYQVTEYSDAIIDVFVLKNL